MKTKEHLFIARESSFMVGATAECTNFMAFILTVIITCEGNADIFLILYNGTNTFEAIIS